MSRHKITQLTPAQVAAIPGYLEKWTKIALSPEPINRQQVAEAVIAIYDALGLKAPQILIFDNIYPAVSEIVKFLDNPFQMKIGDKLGEKIEEKLRNQLLLQTISQISSQSLTLLSQLWDKLPNPVGSGFLLSTHQEREFRTQLGCQVWNPLRNYICGWNKYICFIDFCITELNCRHDAKIWSAFDLLAKNWAVIFPYEKLCYVCDRPIKVCLDNSNLLQERGEAVIFLP
ncbi:hypothetical protein H6S82_16145 [Planktothrix sp. FACHB-1355]|uniref:Uncharacterized protein n=1 Tax=Aerosakkonema funiforme FACHB-1375 TaxID=2949571 RepID=A0A926VJW5_9CYAN|nr:MULTISPECIES: hypothetical protein [Oscillatoriales]MBD2184593.1 hypothetical protein [Aerosakkonema funiforme FACHB-1375]MBD3560372.1 hypothetical protein [Planktothrix sp. FACHB-1355]